MNLCDLFKKAKFSLESAILEPGGGGFYLDECTDIAPCDYLQFAKEDIKFGNLKGLINAITNAKRSIDCQIDNFMTSIGYDYMNIRIHPYSFDNFVKDPQSGNLKLKLLENLEVVPLKLMSKVRKLRNRVEHEYFCPTEDDAGMAVELAELFIGNLRHRIFIEDFSISNCSQNPGGGELSFSWIYDKEPGIISRKNCWCIEHRSINENSKVIVDEIKIKTDSSLYLYLTKLSLALDSEEDTKMSLKILLEVINYLTPECANSLNKGSSLEIRY